jgi:hypothetical protein
MHSQTLFSGWQSLCNAARGSKSSADAIHEMHGQERRDEHSTPQTSWNTSYFLLRLLLRAVRCHRSWRNAACGSKSSVVTQLLRSDVMRRVGASQASTASPTRAPLRCARQTLTQPRRARSDARGRVRSRGKWSRRRRAGCAPPPVRRRSR